jgi:hypothetical protein
MDTEDRVVWFHNRGGDLRARPNGEAELGLLAVIHREALEHQAAEARASATTAGVVDHEALEAGAVVGELANAIQDQIDDLLAYGIVPAP